MFFTFIQNNSAGTLVFEKERGITHFVIIEADSAKQANIEAIDKGVYFDGCSRGEDYPCCGDRWYSQNGEGDSVPLIYGKSPAEHVATEVAWLWMKPNPEVAVHYKDGRIEWF